MLKSFNTFIIKLGLKEYCKYSLRGYEADISFIPLAVQYFKTLFSAKNQITEATKSNTHTDIYL